MGSGHQKGGWHECRELETSGDELGHLGHGQACSLVFECKEKPSKGFKGETGMIIYAGIFGVMAWVAAGRRGWKECCLGRVGAGWGGGQSGDGDRTRER